MNSFGRIFRISIFGESHGVAVGVVIDGCPAGIKLAIADFSDDLNRRKPGADGTTARIEEDQVEIISGIFNDQTTGAPIMLMLRNHRQDSHGYDQFLDHPRPGHADFTAALKYNHCNDYRGSGHFSGRITAALVLAGVIAKKILKKVRIDAGLLSAGGSKNITEAVKQAVAEQDSIGGIVECQVQNLPAGLGEPFFDSAESVISHLVFAIPGIRGIEFGDGFLAATQKGSEHNDIFLDSTGQTQTNHAGGVNGGITNGNKLIFRVAVKPTSSILKGQHTYNFKAEKMTELTINGRHDSCFALRVPVILESVTAIALADLMLIKNGTSV